MVVKKTAKQRAVEKAEKRKKVEWQKHFARIRREGKQSDREKTRSLESPLIRIKRAGTLDVYELTAADEMLAAYHHAIGQPASRDPDLDVPIQRSRIDSVENAYVRQSDMLYAFRQWKADLAETVVGNVTMLVLFSEMPLQAIDRRMRWTSGKAKELFVCGIRHFAALRKNTPRGAHDWKISPSQTSRVIVDKP